MNRRPAHELLGTPGALLDRRALAELGLQRRSIDKVFRELPVVALPGVRRAYVRADDVRRFLNENTFLGDERIRPTE
jgi:hypothetical protein